jgi:predicted N-acetyltransferase YhbS
MTDLSVTILTEKPEDAPAIERLHERTFGPGRFVRTSERIRERIGHELDLSYTARVGTLMVGSVRLTRICIDETPALLLGPLTIEPPFRDRGIGKAMMERALKDAKEKGYKLVVLVGDVPYYARVGFKRVPNGAIKMPGPADPARILAAELTDGALTGVTGVVRPDWDSQKDSQ